MSRWAHARRKFFEAQKTDAEGALYALGVIRQVQDLLDTLRKTKTEQEPIFRWIEGGVHFAMVR